MRKVYYNRSARKFEGLDNELLKDLHESYKGVDIIEELNRMMLWLDTKGKQRKGTLGFIMNWLSKCAKHTFNQDIEVAYSDTSLGKLYRAYNEELWKDRQHLLAFNTISRAQLAKAQTS